MHFRVGQAYLDFYGFPTTFLRGVWVPVIILCLMYIIFTVLTFYTTSKLRHEEVGTGVPVNFVRMLHHFPSPQNRNFLLTFVYFSNFDNSLFSFWHDLKLMRVVQIWIDVLSYDRWSCHRLPGCLLPKRKCSKDSNPFKEKLQQTNPKVMLICRGWNVEEAAVRPKPGGPEATASLRSYRWFYHFTNSLTRYASLSKTDIRVTISGPFCAPQSTLKCVLNNTATHSA